MSDEYLAQHVRDALASDPRVGELGISVTVEPGQAYLAGQVSTDDRRDAIVAVTREVLPDHEVRCEVNVAPVSEPDGVEMLP